MSKYHNRLGGFRLSLKGKLLVSLSSIAFMLLISSVISILEFTRMKSYVSGLIADNVNSLNLAESLTGDIDAYNLNILAVIGDETVSTLPDFDQEKFVSWCDSLKLSLQGEQLLPSADSVLASFSAYMNTSMELEDVIKSDFIDTRTWYFDRLQKDFNKLRSDMDRLNDDIYNDLKRNSETFDRGFYRSIVPGMVAVGVGILLVLMLAVFMLIYYVNPIYKMLDSLDTCRTYGKKYNYVFEGDDQLTELNAGITEICDENRLLKRRIKDLKDRNTDKDES
jgi:hypothetical protein